jgi:3-oxoacyl-[acyl-carrier-protein] synthase II
MRRRVVITGLGLCTPVGNTVATFWDNLLAGRSGIGPVTMFDASALPVRIGGEVKGLDFGELAESFPGARGEWDRKIWLGLAAARPALASAGLGADDLAAAALYVGVSLEAFDLARVATIGGAGDLERRLERLVDHVPAVQTPLDRLTQLLGDHYGMGGGRCTNCSACAAGAQAIGQAFRRVRSGVVEVAVAGASDSTLDPLGLGGFGLLRILSPENDRPREACRPFDATRQGTVLSEGAAFVVLENEEHARSRGAKVLAEVLGYGTSLDAFRVTDPEPNGRGAASSMRRAMADAGLTPREVDGINAHGTGTPKNDVAETLAIKGALGDRARQIPVTAIKSMTGHMIAASGAAAAVASVLTLATGRIPPTINRRQPDPECDLDYVAEGARGFAGRTVLANSFGFGGQNATLIFGKGNGSGV